MFKCQHTHMVTVAYPEWNANPAGFCGGFYRVAKCVRLGYHVGQHRDAENRRWY